MSLLKPVTNSQNSQSITMSLNLPTLLLLLLLLSLSSSRDRNVLQLSDGNFQKQLLVNENLLVMFFIPWSGMCQKFRPHFAQAADILQDDLPIVLAKMDCSGLGRKTCDHMDLQSRLPSLQFFHKGEFVKEYTGARDARSIVKFLRVQVVPDPVELKSVEELKEFLSKQDDVVVVGFFEEHTRLRRLYFRVAEEMKERIIFAHSSNERLLNKQGVFNGIVLFRPRSLYNYYEAERILFTGRSVIGEITNFIIKNYHGLVGHRTPNNRYDFTYPIIIVYYTVDYHSDGKEQNYWRIRLLKIASKYKDHVIFAISAMDDFDDEIDMSEVDHSIAVHPVVIATDLESKRYVMKDDFSTESLDKFVQDFIDKKLTPFVKSKLPQENDGAVVIAVASNFEQVVLNNSKDTLLDLYSPWSLRCKKFAPVLREVAELIQDENVAIVRIDTTANELPAPFADLNAPNTYFLEKNRKSHPILYSGGRNVQDIIEFIAKYATHELRGYDRSGDPKRGKDEL